MAASGAQPPGSDPRRLAPPAAGSARTRTVASLTSKPDQRKGTATGSLRKTLASKIRGTDPGKFDAKTGEHLRPADAALPFDTIGDCPVAINAPGTVEVDTMFDGAKIMIDNHERAAQRRKVAG